MLILQNLRLLLHRKLYRWQHRAHPETVSSRWRFCSSDSMGQNFGEILINIHILPAKLVRKCGPYNVTLMRSQCVVLRTARHPVHRIISHRRWIAFRRIGTGSSEALLWRHNERDGVSNHQPHDCLLSRLFRRRSKKTSKLRVTGLCAGNSPVNGGFPPQMASNAENVSIWWRHHGQSDPLLPDLLHP